MQADSALSPAILAVADSMWRARPLADGADAYSRVPRGALCRPSRPATLASRARALRCDWSLGPRTRSCALRRMRFFEYVVRFFCTAISSLSTSHGGGGEAPESAEGAAPSRLGTSRWSDADGASGQGSSAPTHSASVGPLRGGKAGAEGAAGVQVRHARNPKLSCPNADAGQWRWRMLAAATAAAAQPWRAAAAGVPRRRSRSMLSSGAASCEKKLRVGVRGHEWIQHPGPHTRTHAVSCHVRPNLTRVRSSQQRWPSTALDAKTTRRASKALGTSARAGAAG